MAVLAALGHKLVGAATAALLATGGMVAIGGSAAMADTAPTDPTEPATVSADALPTAQIDGVAWEQVIVGNTVYVGGRFGNARPAGAAAGTQLSPRQNLMAYNLTTGVMTSFAPNVNGQVLDVTASPDGSRIYIAGEFTQVNGQTRNRVAAFNTADGSLVATFRPSLDFRARTVLATATTVYVGGAFGTAGGQPRNSLAAFNAANGAVLPWAPVVAGSANPTNDPTRDAAWAAADEIFDLALSPDAGKLVLAGRFGQVNGAQARGMAAVSTSDGSSLPWVVNQRIQNYGPDSAIYSLTSDNDNVYGTGYDYYGPSNFENVFAARWSDGELGWVNGCLGDTYDVSVQGSVVYSAGHPHNCTPIGGHPQTEPWTFQRASATTTTPSGTNAGGPFDGAPKSRLLQWLPDLQSGTFTGQSQAAWNVTSNASYVVMGGEFPRVNNTPQQGLVRFAVRSVAPNAQGPRDTANLAPTLTSLSPGTVRISWQSAWDRDNRTLTYEVYRGSTVIGTVTGDSAWWSRPNLAFTDRTAPAGTTQTYRIRVSDPLGNRVASSNVSIDVPTGEATQSAYAAAVVGDGASSWWRLGEPVGSTTGYDWVGANDLVVDPSAVRGTDGALPEANTATTFSGTVAAPASSSNLVPGPDTFTVEAWINTTTNRGGKVIGFGNSATGTSSSYDRHVYMDDAGRLVFGVYPNAERRLTTTAAYNDGQWHHVVASLGSGGMDLYVDGRRVGRRTDTTSGQAYSGFWRVGGDSTWGSSSASLAGRIDEVAVYPTALSLQQVSAHYTASGRQVTGGGVRPTDAYGQAVFDAEPQLFWRLGENAGATTAVDTTANDTNGNAFGGTTFGATGRIGTGASFDGSDDGVSSSRTFDNPTTYSQELWFSTTSTDGGKLIGFGASPTGTSGNYDRHVYMNNDGRLVFGVWTGSTNTITSEQPYNDGAWHHVVATQGSDGMKLYVDGQLLGTNGQTGSQGYTGYWRIGGDNHWGCCSPFFRGSLDEVAVYDRVLTPAEVGDHFTKGGGLPANVAPTAAFTSSSTGLAAAFDGSGSVDPDGTIASYAWNFGDGATATGPTPSHTYATANTYSVSLTVTDDRGGVHTATQPVTVAPVPNTAPTASFTSGTRELTVDVDASASSDVDGTIASYRWDFGDNTPFSTTPSASHTYAAAGTYTVTLTVTDDDGATATQTQTVTVALTPVNQSPAASFTATPTDLSVAFDASGSTDPDGTVVSYAWNFGDTGTSTLVSPTHSYAVPGTYTVTLTVTDDDGATSTTSSQVTAVAPPANQAPTASFTATPTDLTVAVDASGSSDSDGTIASYAWNFGDGGTATGVTASHPYAVAGTYTVSLTVTDDDGATATTTRSVVVTAPAPVNVAPAASFSTAGSGLAVGFDATGSADGDGTIASYGWNFGDTTTGTGVTTSHTYAAAGTYTVTLTVTDDDGATGTSSQSVTVTAVTGPSVIAADGFGRTTTGGFGTAETGGSWTPSGSAANFSVSGGQGRIVMPTAGARRTVFLPSVQQTATDVSAVITLDRAQTGSGTYVSVVGRKIGANEYRIRARYLAGGAVSVALTRSVSGTETVLQSTNLSGTVAEGQPLVVRLQVTGSSPTSLSAKVWRVGATEPPTWQLTATDATTVLQAAGSVGFDTYLSGTSTNAPMTLLVDDLRVTTPGGGTQPPANLAPVAAFGVTASGLTASVDGSASSDSDGAVGSYAWSFGDGAIGSGVTTTHAYAGAGNYTVTLVVTDDDGATGTTTRTVSVTAPPAAGVLVADVFGRTVGAGWGSADTGGTWTTTGTASNFAVAGGVGTITAGAGVRRTVMANGVTVSAVDLTATVSVLEAPAGGPTVVGLVARGSSAGDYRARVRLDADGTATLQILRQVGGTETVIATSGLPGLRAVGSDRITIRVQVTGSGSTTVRARAWQAGSTEPSTWTAAVDTTAALQAPGAVGVTVYTSGAATRPATARVDDLMARPLV